jgi:MFS family permease
MSTPAPKLTTTHWLIIVIASIGFLFDTYELLMTPLVAAPAIAELLQLPTNNPIVTSWIGRLLWIAALCGGVFGLIGGWLVDQFGRKTIMAASIFMYSFSPFAAAYATSIEMFVFFRSTTFIGVCVEFVAAITWMAEVFSDKKQKEKWMGITLAFASLGGVLVTMVSAWINKHGGLAPHRPACRTRLGRSFDLALPADDRHPACDPDRAAAALCAGIEGLEGQEGLWGRSSAPASARSSLPSFAV